MSRLNSFSVPEIIDRIDFNEMQDATPHPRASYQDLQLLHDTTVIDHDCLGMILVKDIFEMRLGLTAYHCVHTEVLKRNTEQGE